MEESMQTSTFNVLDYVERLKNVGQSEAVTEIQIEMMRELMDIMQQEQEAQEEDWLKDIATKGDLRETELRLLKEIEKSKSESTVAIEKIRANLSVEIEKSKNNLTVAIEKNRTEVEKIRADMTAKVEATKTELATEIGKNRTEIEKIRADLTAKVEATRADLATKIEKKSY